MAPDTEPPRLIDALPWLAGLAIVAVVVLVSLIIEPDVHAVAPEPPAKDKAGSTSAEDLPPIDRSSIEPFQGLGTWVDIYDDKLWKNPAAAVSRMSEEGVQTLYLETANYRIKDPIFKPTKTSEFIESAHAVGIDVVAWYLPDFKNLDRDLRRSEAAIFFTTENNHTFDRFALDIESTIVSDVDRRNRRVLRLTEKIREVAGDMALGGITPDPIGSLYWPSFPYAEVAERYDAILPMGYFTYRTSGAKGVRQHVGAGIEALREVTTKDNRIHYIGGLSMDASLAEVRAYRRVLLERRAMGGSMYDFIDTTPTHWDALRSLRKENLVP